MPLTRTRQRNAVSQGLALGLLVRGVTALPTEKYKVDLAFTAAWRGWSHRHLFSQVTTDVGKTLDGQHAVTRADHHKQVAGVHWVQEDHRWVIRSRDPDWDVNNADDVASALDMIGAELPLEAWLALADGFLERVNR